MPLSVRTGPALGGDERDARAGQPAEHLVRADRVECREPVVQQDRDVHRLVSLSLIGAASGARPRVRIRGVRLRDAARLEAAAVLGRADVERAQEHAAHRLGRAEAARGGDRRDRLAAVLEPPARGLEPHALDVARRRHAGLGAKGAREVARAHVRSRRHRLDGVLAGDVLDDAALDLAQRLARAAAAPRASR